MTIKNKKNNAAHPFYQKREEIKSLLSPQKKLFTTKIKFLEPKVVQLAHWFTINKSTILICLFFTLCNGGLYYLFLEGYTSLVERGNEIETKLDSLAKVISTMEHKIDVPSPPVPPTKIPSSWTDYFNFSSSILSTVNGIYAVAVVVWEAIKKS